MDTFPLASINIWPQPVAYLIMLREPINRLISHYYYVKRTPGHYLYQQVTSTNMDLAAYVGSSISSELNNGQVRLLSGVKTVDTVFGHEPITPEILEIAKSNLSQHFIWVGLFEKFNESLLCLRNRMGWKRIYYAKENRTFARPATQDISRQALQVIEKYNELDLELYEFFDRKFEEHFQEHRIDPKKMISLRLRNKIYGTPHRLLNWAKRVAQRLLCDLFKN